MIETTTCYVIKCDVCGYAYDADGEGVEHHLERGDAEDAARDAGWVVVCDQYGDRAVCTDIDTAHDKARPYRTDNGETVRFTHPETDPERTIR